MEKGRKKDNDSSAFSALSPFNSHLYAHLCSHRDHRRQNRVSRRAPTSEELPVFLLFCHWHRQQRGVFLSPFLSTRAGAARWIFHRSIRKQTLVPVRVSHGRRERASAAERAGRDSAASGDGRRRRNHKTSARSSPGGRRQRGRRAAREGDCHGRGTGRRTEMRRRQGEKEKRSEKRNESDQLASLAACFCEGRVFSPQPFL